MRCIARCAILAYDCCAASTLTCPLALAPPPFLQVDEVKNIMVGADQWMPAGGHRKWSILQHAWARAAVQGIEVAQRSMLLCVVCVLLPTARHTWQSLGCRAIMSRRRGSASKFHYAGCPPPPPPFRWTTLRRCWSGVRRSSCWWTRPTTCGSRCVAAAVWGRHGCAVCCHWAGCFGYRCIVQSRLLCAAVGWAVLVDAGRQCRCRRLLAGGEAAAQCARRVDVQ